ncbi:EAL domain-containing protein [Trichocoleus sp. DQ-A3]|uniref:EAL domain-containing protein n=1 Tax=Cyanophyceae TaxID=3028117 RepID=UPI0016856240|nr:EAL domain-containing protein [Coleofasciculus sp. FACHB-125]MBD1898407.1 EAL domain-containing protein [Coleofasciculus sp. FACHB-125]
MIEPKRPANQAVKLDTNYHPRIFDKNISFVPRQISPKQSEALRIIARQVAAQQELRRGLNRLTRAPQSHPRGEEQQERFFTLSEERLRLLESIVINANDAIVITEAEPLEEPLGPRIVYVNQTFTQMTGYQPEEVIGKTPRLLQGPKTERSQLDKIRQALSRWEPVRVELINYRKDGSDFWVELNILPLADSTGWFTHLLAVQRDITERKAAEYELKSHARASAVVAQLGQGALSGTNLDVLMQEAVKLVAQTLEVPFCQVLELMPGGNALFLRAGVGWQEGLVGSAIIGAHDRSQAGYTLLTGKPVIVEDLRIETRFSGTPLLHNHRAIAGMSVIIHSQGNPFGVLSVHTPNYRRFTEDEVHFLQAVANVLATANERQLAEEALRESEERYALAVRGSNEGLWDWNLKAETFYFSPRWKSMLGCQEDEIGDSPEEWFNRVHPEDLERVKSAIAAHLEGLTHHFEKEYRMLHKDKTYRWMLCRGMAIRDANDKAYRMAGSQTDITDRKVAEEHLIYDAFHDPLTGLPNRALFMERLSQAIARTRRQPEYLFAVLFLDLDRFKVVNDSLGHVIGDQLLIALAKRLQSSVASCLQASVCGSNTVARLGGDEFVILLEEIQDIDVVEAIAKSIQKDLRHPFNLDRHEVVVTASIGITLSAIEQRGSSGTYKTCPYPGDILRDADIALYQAKALGKARYEVFTTAMHTHAVARLQLENDLRQALARTEVKDRLQTKTVNSSGYSSLSRESASFSHSFLLHYQPIVCFMTGRITGFEALVRLSHPFRGLISPVDFIPIAEETGLIIPLGAWVLREACRQMRLWQQEFPDLAPLTISVNLSGRQFSKPNLVEQIQQILQETELPAPSLKLEITESVVMENAAAATASLEQLSNSGIQLSIDDFGTGYSSLSYLHRFPLNTLKIDRSFVSRMDAGENSEIVKTIVTLAHHLGLDVIAEGVETAAQMEQLRSLRCEAGQGFFFSKPLDSESARALIAAMPQW